MLEDVGEELGGKTGCQSEGRWKRHCLKWTRCLADCLGSESCADRPTTLLELVGVVSRPLTMIAKRETIRRHEKRCHEVVALLANLIHKLEMNIEVVLRHLSRAQSLKPHHKAPTPSCAPMPPHGVDIEDIQLAGEW